MHSGALRRTRVRVHSRRRDRAPAAHLLLERRGGRGGPAAHHRHHDGGAEVEQVRGQEAARGGCQVPAQPDGLSDRQASAGARRPDSGRDRQVHAAVPESGQGGQGLHRRQRPAPQPQGECTLSRARSPDLHTPTTRSRLRFSRWDTRSPTPSCTSC